jgi:signal transduction histidine kinase
VIEESNLALFTLAHDLRAHLRTILTQGQRILKLNDESVSDDIRQRVGDMVAAGKRQEELIASIVELEQARQENASPSYQPAIPLRIAIQTACTKTEPLRATASGEVLFDASTCPPAAVSSSVSKILEKVIHNALKFHARGETPVVRIEPQVVEDVPGWVRIRVRDRGIGIEPQFRTAVFEPFKRLNPVSSYPGSGLGLSIALLLIRRIGGEISIEEPLPYGDEKDLRGTAVSLRIPPFKTVVEA